MEADLASSCCWSFSHCSRSQAVCQIQRIHQLISLVVTVLRLPPCSLPIG
uniref:Uncharacterized protein n=1 Tax=Siphoviridae sp. ctXOZ1 TaxID=2823585 RepID=A0A8S5LB76_9CAUD|nr:MAG TPA: hypothetical protein [Siphoviridae sp. ctXOZ1]